MEDSFRAPSSPSATDWIPLDSMEDFTITKQSIIMHDGHVIPGENNQDWVKILKTENDNAAIVVLDGHGRGNVVNYLKTQVLWEKILDDANPINSIRFMIKSNISNLRNDGSTFASVEAIPGAFRCRWLGDTEIVIYHNGKLCWRSSKHTPDNNAELARVIQMGVQIVHCHSLQVVNDSTITLNNSGYCMWSPANPAIGLRKDQCNVTRSFGHTNKANAVDGEMRIIKFNKPGNWRAVVFTDGVGDIIHEKDLNWIGKIGYRASQITEQALNRWDKHWKYLHPLYCSCTECKKNGQTLETIPIQIGKGKSTADDIGVAVLEVNVEV